VTFANIKTVMEQLWRGLRTATGDDAYERYLAHHAVEHAGNTPLSRRAYYDEYQRQKWSGINRCC
jgi:uncharacterized short protein YbdD (DUF466 family)